MIDKSINEILNKNSSKYKLIVIYLIVLYTVGLTILKMFGIYSNYVGPDRLEAQANSTWIEFIIFSIQPLSASLTLTKRSSAPVKTYWPVLSNTRQKTADKWPIVRRSKCNF